MDKNTLMSGGATEASQSNTVKNVSAQYGGLIIVRRWIGAWIDFAICVLIIFSPHLLGHDIPADREFILWIPVLAYFIVGECQWGRTVGKLLTGTVVVDENGKFPRLGQVIFRTLFRVIEVNPILLGAAPAGLVAIMSKHKQRMGDKAAQTFVIVAKDLRDLRVAKV